jgi:hypothetical protein
VAGVKILLRADRDAKEMFVIEFLPNFSKNFDAPLKEGVAACEENQVVFSAVLDLMSFEALNASLGTMKKHALQTLFW